MSTKLYVGNLSFDSNEHDLRGLFEQAGTVTDAVVIEDKMTGRSRGFGFITMSSAEEARAAVEQFNGKEFQGRSLTVNEARPREEFGAGGGGGGGGGQSRGGGGGGYKRNFGGGGGGGGDRRGGGGGGGNRRY